MKLKIFITILYTCLSIYSQAQVSEIPFKFQHSHLFIKVRLNDTDSLNFIFDTGCIGTTIDSAVAEHAGIKQEKRRSVTVNGLGGSATYAVANHETLHIGNLELNDISLVLANMEPFSKSMGMRLDGIIGYDLLKTFVTKVNFGTQQILLYNQINEVDTAGYTAVPFELNPSILIPQFPVTINFGANQTVTDKIMFDTGNAFTLMIRAPFSKLYDLKNTIGDTKIAEGLGANAKTTDMIANINNMTINGFKFGKMGVRVRINDRAVASSGNMGLLGIQVIKRFHFITDYQKRRLYLRPNSYYDNAFVIEVDKGDLARGSRDFLRKNKLMAGIVTSPTGLQYKIIEQGRGPKPSLQDKVSLHFRAKLFTGENLWSTDPLQPWAHHLDKALPGLREAVLHMQVGAKWQLFIPPHLAFGKTGFEEVPPNAALIYEVELLGIEKNK